MANALAIQHSQQIEDGYCLPACIQMGLAYLGIVRSQQEIARIIKIRRGFGAGAPNVTNLQTKQIAVAYYVHGTIKDIHQKLRDGYPSIVFIQAGELPYWRNVSAQHAVLVVGLDGNTIYLHDPALNNGPTHVTLGDFLLAWDEMDNRYAVISESRD